MAANKQQESRTQEERLTRGGSGLRLQIEDAGLQEREVSADAAHALQRVRDGNHCPVGKRHDANRRKHPAVLGTQQQFVEVQQDVLVLQQEREKPTLNGQTSHDVAHVPVRHDPQFRRHLLPIRVLDQLLELETVGVQTRACVTHGHYRRAIEYGNDALLRRSVGFNVQHLLEENFECYGLTTPVTRTEEVFLLRIGSQIGIQNIGD